MGNAQAVDFATYVAILGQSAMMHLGKIMNPATGKIERELNQAKFVIDILGILEEKTKGNLSHEEQQLLESTLASLRMNYVEEAPKGDQAQSDQAETSTNSHEPQRTQDAAQDAAQEGED